MSWLPDSGWLRALHLRASTLAAVALGCWAVLGLAEFGLLYLDALPTWVRALFVIIAVVASLLWLVRICLAHFERWQRRNAVLAHLDALSKDEKVLLSRALKENTRCITIFSFHPAALSLKTKGLVESSLVIGEDASHIIPSNVWKSIKTRTPDVFEYSNCVLGDE
jgi:hypothetical protein